MRIGNPPWAWGSSVRAERTPVDANLGGPVALRLDVLSLLRQQTVLQPRGSLLLKGLDMAGSAQEHEQQQLGTAGGRSSSASATSAKREVFRAMADAPGKSEAERKAAAERAKKRVSHWLVCLRDGHDRCDGMALMV